MFVLHLVILRITLEEFQSHTLQPSRPQLSRSVKSKTPRIQNSVVFPPPTGPQVGLGTAVGGSDLLLHRSVEQIKKSTILAAHYLCEATSAREDPQVYALDEVQCDAMLHLLKEYMAYSCQSAGSCSHGVLSHSALYDGLRDLASVLLPQVFCQEGDWAGLDTIWRFYSPKESNRRPWVPPADTPERPRAPYSRTGAPTEPRSAPPSRGAAGARGRGGAGRYRPVPQPAAQGPPPPDNGVPGGPPGGGPGGNHPGAPGPPGPGRGGWGRRWGWGWSRSRGSNKPA